MTLQEGIGRLESALMRNGRDQYRFACPKALLRLRLLGAKDPVQFSMRDKVGFQIDDRGLCVVELKTGTVRSQFHWGQVESLAAGEPETDSGSLFQG
jgi:hypothetical protein